VEQTNLRLRSDSIRIGIGSKDLKRRPSAVSRIPLSAVRPATRKSPIPGLIMLPGGFGPPEEFFEVLTRIGIHQQPRGMLNVDGFFQLLLGLSNHSSHNVCA